MHSTVITRDFDTICCYFLNFQGLFSPEFFIDELSDKVSFLCPSLTDHPFLVQIGLVFLL